MKYTLPNHPGIFMFRNMRKEVDLRLLPRAKGALLIFWWSIQLAPVWGQSLSPDGASAAVFAEVVDSNSILSNGASISFPKYLSEPGQKEYNRHVKKIGKKKNQRKVIKNDLFKNIQFWIRIWSPYLRWRPFRPAFFRKSHQFLLWRRSPNRFVSQVGCGSQIYDGKH